MDLQHNRDLLALCLATIKGKDLTPAILKRRNYQLRDRIPGSQLGIADACIYENDQHLVVCFRGTEAKSDEWKQVLTTAQHRIDDKLWVHRGFHRILQEHTKHGDLKGPFVEVLGKRILEHVEALKKPVILTGHSLGGALACLGLEYFSRQAHLSDILTHTKYIATFGAPRPGGQGWKESFERATAHIVKKAYGIVTDSVPFVPPMFAGFAHGIEPILIVPKGAEDKAHNIGPGAVIKHFAKMLRALDSEKPDNQLTMHSITSYIRHLDRAGEKTLEGAYSNVAQSTSGVLGVIGPHITPGVTYGLRMLIALQRGLIPAAQELTSVVREFAEDAKNTFRDVRDAAAYLISRERNFD